MTTAIIQLIFTIMHCQDYDLHLVIFTKVQLRL